jgi:hypothetical protein
MICQGCCDSLFALNRKLGLAKFLAPLAVVTAHPVQGADARRAWAGH